ncbi:UNVERIFIED_CONTAM: hypothetical protein GTU68_006944 [Idotea baltica]|nr:hypothetical protein [Idotea baltica]
MKNQGIPDDEFRDKPVIGICNTWSELTPCNGHFRELAESVKKGVLQAGGFPLEFPVMSLGETLIKPTAMLYRNLMSMDVEESIRANPIDGVILLCGCDKTTPASVMGACSVDIPTLVVSGGPMLTGKYEGKNIATSDIWRFADEVTKGTFTNEAIREAEACMCRSDGHCAVMGTASTMACMVEALGLTLPGNAAIPAADSRRKVLAQFSGRRIVEMVKEDLTISKVLTREAFENAIKINAAIGGSTNFVLHLLAIAGRIEVPLELDDFDEIGSKIPLLANLQPSGEYFMEDFYYAGGLPAIINQLRKHLHNDVITVTGKTIGENNEGAKIYGPEVIAAIDQPFQEEAGIVVVRGNLATKGTVIKPSAATPALMKHRGKAVVFEDIEDYHARINSDDLEVEETNILVLKNVGPKGYPGMPEVGNMGLPKKLLAKGVTDMVRISDGRMSGTAFGTVFLHVAPESAGGGTLALVENGDEIEVDVAKRYIHLHVSDQVLAERRTKWKAPDLGFNRGYISHYIKHVEEADLGADLDFLRGKSGNIVTRDSH